MRPSQGQALAPPLASQEDLDALVSRISHVFSRSFRDVPPVPADGGPLAVGVRIELVKFQSLDEVGGTVDLVLDLLLCWADARLAIDSNRTFHRPWSHAGDKLTIRSNLVWTPDIVVMNQIEGMDAAFESDSSPLALADSEFMRRTGVNVMWTRRVNVKSGCDINMARFPFDVQRCQIVLGSWASSKEHMVLVAQDARQKIDSYSWVHTQDFLVKSVRVKRQEVFSRDKIQTFDEIAYEITVERQPHFYIVNFIMPIAAVTMMTIATMWMSSYGTRTNSATRLLLCVVSIMNITAKWRPANEGDIWLDRFQSHCLALSMASVLQSLVLDYLHGTGVFEMSICFCGGHAIETVMRTTICLSAIVVFAADLCELKQQDSVRGLFFSFHSRSSALIFLVLYSLVALLGLSSIFSALWIVLPRQVFQRYFGKDCTKVATTGVQSESEHAVADA